MFLRALPFLALFLALPAPAAPVVKTEHVEATLVTQRTSVQPGKPGLVGLKLRMAPHWHTYWKNPGDSGLPTRIKWTLPAGWKAGEIQWPYPSPLPVGPLLNFGYEGEVVLLTEMTPPADAKPGIVEIKANADWLVCREICIPEKGEIDLVWTVAAAEGPLDGRAGPAIDRAQLNLPATPSGWSFAGGVSGKRALVKITPPAGTSVPDKAFFFPERENLIDYPVKQLLTREGNSLVMEMRLVEPVAKDITTLSGVIVAEAGWPGLPGRKAISVNAPVDGKMAIAPATVSTTPGAPLEAPLGGSMALALGFAFLGGLLLNLMPCVFPVLGIKVLGFVEHAHGDAKAMRLQGLVFALGVLVSFLVLAGVLLALRAGGTQLGWGFQLQSPLFVTALAGLFFLLALNLSGVFEWGLFAQSLTSNVSARGRYADAFLAGVLATAVATPCTAPFMGAAVGFTLAQPAPVALLVFAMLALGMALPVVALAFFPALLKRLPRPGAWMETFKQVMAFPLYATVAWLTWVLGAQAGNDAVLGFLAGLVALAIAAWIYGRWSHSASFWRPAFTAVFTVLGLWLAWPGEFAPPATGAMAAPKAGELPWQAWSPEKVAESTAQGKAVFVDFTAAWCVTCQLNKRTALHREDVIKAFAERGVVALKADWTNQDPRITQALAELGRNAVPVYALYLPGESAPRLLPEILTSTIVLAEIARLPALAPPTTTVTQR